MKAINALLEISDEMERQHLKFGEQNHPDGTGSVGLRTMASSARKLCDSKFSLGKGTWYDILREEFHEAMAESDQESLRAELVQVAAVAASWINAIDRRKSK